MSQKNTEMMTQTIIGGSQTDKKMMKPRKVQKSGTEKEMMIQRKIRLIGTKEQMVYKDIEWRKNLKYIIAILRDFNMFFNRIICDII